MFREEVSQRVHVGIWYILKAQRGSQITTLRPKYLPYSYMDPLGMIFAATSYRAQRVSECQKEARMWNQKLREGPQR